VAGRILLVGNSLKLKSRQQWTKRRDARGGGLLGWARDPTCSSKKLLRILMVQVEVENSCSPWQSELASAFAAIQISATEVV